MKQIVGYHHFKGTLGVVEEVERRVVGIIETSGLPDEKRDSSKCWEVKHSSGTVQFARLLAQRRGLDESIAAIALALHDVYVIEHGRYRDHAHLGAPIAAEILSSVPGLSSSQIELIVRMIAEHSDKEVFSDDPYVELAKDADVLDCFMYPEAEQFYLTAKPLRVCKYYFRRIARIRAELGLPSYARYECLESFAPGWLAYRGEIALEALSPIIAGLFPPEYDPKSTPAGVAVFLLVNRTTVHCFGVEPTPFANSSCEMRPDIMRSLSVLRESESSVLVCWPAFDAWEVSKGARSLTRLTELSADIPPDLESQLALYERQTTS